MNQKGLTMTFKEGDRVILCNPMRFEDIETDEIIDFQRGEAGTICEDSDGQLGVQFDRDPLDVGDCIYFKMLRGDGEEVEVLSQCAPIYYPRPLLPIEATVLFPSLPEFVAAIEQRGGTVVWSVTEITADDFRCSFSVTDASPELVAALKESAEHVLGDLPPGVASIERIAE